MRESTPLTGFALSVDFGELSRAVSFDLALVVGLTSTPQLSLSPRERVAIGRVREGAHTNTKAPGV